MGIFPRNQRERAQSRVSFSIGKRLMCEFFVIYILYIIESVRWNFYWMISHVVRAFIWLCIPRHRIIGSPIHLHKVFNHIAVSKSHIYMSTWLYWFVALIVGARGGRCAGLLKGKIRTMAINSSCFISESRRRPCRPARLRATYTLRLYSLLTVFFQISNYSCQMYIIGFR